MKQNLSLILPFALLLCLIWPRQEIKAQTSSKESPTIANKGLRAKVKAASQSFTKALTAEINGEGIGFTTLAVLPFKSLDDKSQTFGVSAALTELFSNQLSSSGQIISVERSRIDGVVKELKRVKRAEFSSKGAAQTGKLLGASYVLVGSITTLGAELQVTARLVSSQTGEILSAATMTAPQQQFITFKRDVVVTKSKIGAAARSTLIPGWGQLYNDDAYRGYTMLIASIGILGTAAAYGYLGMTSESEYQENRASTVMERDIGNDHYRKSRIALASYAVLWSYSVVDAYVSGRSDPVIDLKGWSDLESAGVIIHGSF
jgi:TolB-like protein